MGFIGDINMDKIFINDLQVETVIGIFDWEREIKQTISINLEMEFDISKAAKSDDINDSLDYKKVSKRIISLCEKADSYLVENLIEKIAQVVLKEFPVSKVTVSLEKPGALRGSKSVGIKITRS
ncbi:MAG: 7,8-dihydroneopterin aldolase [Gammaproteobacteria bacterium]|jgi:dihydroneopterin aldolase|nr:MAG: 7,8-dihydroneopterin aldolase [Gammaproteobacteria bacterium]|tara:strand:+ start:807 stop:1178 length:372 start_codon:yes stop_codon:yes gene_type:complete